MTHLEKLVTAGLFATLAFACDDGEVVTADSGTTMEMGAVDGTVDPPDMIPERDMAPDMAECEPTAEICNGLDDDCDGVVDNGFEGIGDACTEGVGACAAEGVLGCSEDGAAVVCSAAAGEPGDETCGGGDEDCDGTVDEGFDGVGEPCSAGVGACAASGTIACSEDGLETTCDAVPGEPGEEVCNGIDDNCDGETDENLGGMPCETGEPGACSDGVTACVDGAAECQPVNAPGEEVCDEIDNNCDGEVDNIDGLGDECAAGVGACAAVGAIVCTPDGPACSAVPGMPAPEACDGTDNNCDGEIDNVEGLGEACSVGVGACAADGQLACGPDGLACNAVAGMPAPEACDGTDNNCDGEVDNVEGLGEACSVGVGACQADGQIVCSPEGPVCNAAAGEPGVEVCDGIDNDCDGVVDNVEGLGDACSVGVGACAADGQLACGPDGLACDAVAGEPGVEACDGTDNNCDGEVDNVEGVGDACSAGEGACQADGQIVCSPEGPVCNAVAGQPAREICDGVDNDCNGEVDDAPGVGEPCSAGEGACAADGQTVCGPDGVICDAVPGDGGPEVCDGVDNDCDGAVDNVEGLGEACQAGIGACEVAGELVCGPDGVICDAIPLEPSPEVCDGVDNDCNDEVDDVDGIGDICQVGVGACQADGVFVCGPDGLICDGEPGQPAEELCNEIDDDCNGVVDDEPVCGVPEDCAVEGDEDGNDLADCEDPACAAFIDCIDIGGVCDGITLPADPRNFEARNDIRANGWGDGGNDAFDTYGQITLSANGEQQQLNMLLGRAEGTVGGIAYRTESVLDGNVWTFDIVPVDPANAGVITVTMTGNLGSDGGTQYAELLGGGQLPILRSDDAEPFSDPPVYTALVTGNSNDVVNYDTGRVGFVTATATDVQLPVTMVVALSYAEDAQTVADAIAFGCLSAVCDDFDLPPDPRDYTPNNDIVANGWNDAGGDAFDTYGRLTVTANGENAALDMRLGQREGAIGGVGVTIDSVLEGNVWRYIIEPTDIGNTGPVDVVMTGNLGSDGSTQRTDLVGAGTLPVLLTTEGPANAPTDPPVFTALVPSDRAARAAVEYVVNRDNVTVTASQVRLPVTLVIAVTYADPQAVADAIAGGCGAGAAEPLPEDCAVEGDEDGNGLADCEDPVCADLPECAPVEDCAVEGDEDGNGLADCEDPACAAFPACLPPGLALIPGPQADVPVADVLARGWQECFVGPYNGNNVSVDEILANCPGTQLMLACRPSGADTLTAAGEGLREEVTRDVGTGNNTNNHNGLEWYYDPTDSWGFAPGGEAVSRNSCDTINGDGRLCWHTQAAALTPGYRCGATEGLNGAADWDRVVYARSVVQLGANQAFGHHGNCQSFNNCVTPDRCAELACAQAGLGQPIGWEEGLCTTLSNGLVPDIVCNLFRNNDPVDGYDPGWGPSGNCDIPVVYDVSCAPAPVVVE